ncbi:hypothetical protein U1Q18_012613 [Sarracenia purpurea var. burkii]
MENPQKRATKLPVGYRFHPSDAEILLFYLKRKVYSLPLPQPSFIPHLDVFHTNPWDIPGEPREKRYFFCKRAVNVKKCNRVTDAGYWKGIGKEEHILVSGRNPRAVGVKKTLVFYHGKRPTGLTTQWKMTEYRLLPSEITSPTITQKLKMEMEEWVVCFIHQNKASNMVETKPSVIDIKLMMEDSSELGPPQPSPSSSGAITGDIEVSSKEEEQEITSA